MQPNMYPIDLEHQFLPSDFFKTNLVQKQDSDSLVGKPAPPGQEMSYKTANLGRIYQWWSQDNTSPDAINGVFINRFRTLLDGTFRHGNQEELKSLKDRLTYFTANARVYENFKTSLFANAWTSPMALPSLEPFILEAEKRKEQVEALLRPDQKASPRREQLEKLHQNFGVAITHLLRTDVKELVGIYRIQGEDGKVASLTRAFKETEPDRIKELLAAEGNPHNVAKAMARTIRDLDPPLISDEFYPFFIAADAEATLAEKLKILRSAVKMLPPENQKILQMLFTHLRHLTEQQAVTKMDAKNLAIVWAPNLLKSPQDRLLGDMNAVNNIAMLMIEHDLFS